MNINKLFSQTQLGYIIEISEPIHISSSIDFVKAEFKKNPDINALPIEGENGIEGFIERDAFLKHQSSLGSILNSSIKQYLSQNTISLNARENIEKALKTIFLSGAEHVNNSMVYHLGDFYGTVNTRKLINHILKLRDNELTKAEEIQNCILGSKTITTDHFNANIFLEMSHAVGGDFFLINKLSESTYCIGCLDVSGKDVSASLITGFVSGYFSSLQKLQDTSTCSGTEIINNLHSLIRGKTPEGYFIAGIIIFINVEKKEIELFNMGYSPICLITRGDGENKIYIKNPQLPPIGLPNFTITPDLVLKLQMKPGISLFGYSDGLTDAQNQYGESFGEKRVYEILKSGIKKNDSDILQTINTEVKSFIGKSPQVDDITAFYIDFF
jgi:sigma-B regulation protein RsbU (phosphoserine phosphatase)